MAKITKTICFDTERDADLLAWLATQENTSEAVREALRMTIAPRPPEVTMDKVYQVVLDLRAKIESGTVNVRAETETQNGDAPGTEQAAMALDGLGL